MTNILKITKTIEPFNKKLQIEGDKSLSIRWALIASQVNGKSIALGISLPFEQGVNQYATPELSFEFHYFFVRKFYFLYHAKAVIVFPGGFGTMDELFETLTLIQTKKLDKKKY